MNTKKSKPSVCFIAPNAFPLLAGDSALQIIGGAELQQVLVAKALVGRGYNVSLISWDFGQPELLVVDGIRVIRACRPNAGLPGLRFIYPRLWSIWWALRRAGADIYYHRAAGVLTGLMAAYCQIYGCMSVFAAAGNPDLVRDTPRVRFARDRWIYEYGLRHVSRIVVQNEEQRELCRDNFGRDADLIPNLIFESPNRAQTPRFRILWVSTIRAIKRPDLFLQLAESLPKHQFTMIGGQGEGESTLFDSIRKDAGRISNLEFLGFVPISEVGDHFDKAAVFVNTSESEGFPNTFLQAWSRAIPTVSFVDSGATIDGAPLGVVVQTIHHMSATVDALMRDEPARRFQGERSRQYLEEHHSMEHVIELYDTFFCKLPAKRL